MWFKYRTSFIIAVFFTLLLATFWFLPSFAFIVFISLLLMLLLEPVVDILNMKAHLHRGIASGLVILVTFMIVLGLLVVVSKSLLPSLTKFMTDLPNLAFQIENFEPLHDYSLITNGIDEILSEITNMGIAALKSSMNILLSLFNKLIDLVIIVFVTFYLLNDGMSIEQYIAHLFPEKDVERILNLQCAILNSLQAYIRAQLVMCLITATVVFSYFTLMGLPYASVFAVISGISELVPVLGPTVASICGIMTTGATAPWVVPQTAIFYLILTQINHNLVYPGIIGKTLSLHPVAIILGIILGGEVLGTTGMFLAVPFIVVIKHVISDVHESTKDLI